MGKNTAGWIGTYGIGKKWDCRVGKNKKLDEKLRLDRLWVCQGSLAYGKIDIHSGQDILVFGKSANKDDSVGRPGIPSDDMGHLDNCRVEHAANFLVRSEVLLGNHLGIFENSILCVLSRLCSGSCGGFI